MTWIQTYSGVRFDLLNPQPEMVRITDIAEALSKLNRFTGHTSCQYSVAEHSLHMEMLAPKEHKLWALMHDSAEAYIGDISRPLKQLLPLVRDIEHNILKAIAECFGMPWPVPPIIAEIDNKLLRYETDMLFMLPPLDDWTSNLPELTEEEKDVVFSFEAHDPDEIRHAFIDLFLEYTKQ